MIRTLLVLLLPMMAQAEPLRVATYNTELGRDGPGLMLRDIRRDHQQVLDVVAVISTVSPDVLALQGLDWDQDGLALKALADKLTAAGVIYPYHFARMPNSGIETDLDLDGDGRRYGPGDAMGWGRFTGQGGLAVLSRYPIAADEVQDYSTLLWRDLPGAVLPLKDGLPFPSEQAQAQQRLSSTAHWVVPIDAPWGRFHLLTFHASPPVFDGPEDRNGLRNRDEIRLWRVLLDGALGPAPERRFVISGDANLDPLKGDGLNREIMTLLTHPLLQDARPSRPHARPPDALDTVEWDGVGQLRVDYVLPSRDWAVLDAGVFWPAPGEPEYQAARGASRHRLVWVDLAP